MANVVRYRDRRCDECGRHSMPTCEFGDLGPHAIVCFECVAIAFDVMARQPEDPQPKGDDDHDHKASGN